MENEFDQGGIVPDSAKRNPGFDESPDEDFPKPRLIPYEYDHVAFEEEIMGLEAKVRFLIDILDGHELLEEGCFTFPDGDTWWASRSLISESDDYYD